MNHYLQFDDIFELFCSKRRLNLNIWSNTISGQEYLVQQKWPAQLISFCSFLPGQTLTHNLVSL